MCVGRLRLTARLPAEAQDCAKAAGAMDCQSKAGEENSSIVMLKMKMFSECPDVIKRLSRAMSANVCG